MAIKNKKEDKVLIALIVIFLVSIIGFNLNKLTGGIVIQENKDVPIVTVSPSTIKAGEYVTVNVKVRNACVHPTVELFFSGTKFDGTKTHESFRLGDVTKQGRYKFCKGDYGLKDNSFKVTYKTSAGWGGDYYARVYYWTEDNTKDYVHSYFRVRPN